MKVVIAPDSFKGSMSSVEVASAIEVGVKKTFPDACIVKIPVADGGEGTVEALVSSVGGTLRQVEVTAPMGNRISAVYGILDNGIAVIEAAAASGLPLVKEDEKNPMYATSYGTGELIKAALDEGCRKIVLGIGGTATNDGGIGAAQALGVSFKDKDGKELGFGGGELDKLEYIDTSRIDSRLANTEITIASDVTNTLCGEKGASAVFGPQKGATPEMVKVLDANLAHYASVILRQFGKNVLEIPGTGAAGGLGIPFLLFSNATFKSGIEIVLDIADFDRIIEDADLVITGEGRIDFQSVFGKVPTGVAKYAFRHKVPVLAIVGSIGDGASEVYLHGIDSIMSNVSSPMSLEEAMEKSFELTVDAAERAAKMIRIGLNMKQIL